MTWEKSISSRTEGNEKNNARIALGFATALGFAGLPEPPEESTLLVGTVGLTMLGTFATILMAEASAAMSLGIGLNVEVADSRESTIAFGIRAIWAWAASGSKTKSAEVDRSGIVGRASAVGIIVVGSKLGRTGPERGKGETTSKGRASRANKTASICRCW